MDAAERTLVLERWNATARDYPQRNIAELFEAEAERRPDAVAVVFGAEQISYAELNRRANRLGRYLQARGVVPDTPIGLYLERSVEMIVALLGILKAGGAYVALDPTYRPERLALMLENADVPLLLTEKRLKDGLPDYKGTLVFLEEERAEIDRNRTRISAVALASIIWPTSATPPARPECRRASPFRIEEWSGW